MGINEIKLARAVPNNSSQDWRFDQTHRTQVKWKPFWNRKFRKWQVNKNDTTQARQEVLTEQANMDQIVEIMFLRRPG